MIRLARPLLGTLVTIEADGTGSDAMKIDAIHAAFEVVARIGRVMSAHDRHSDLGRMSRATPGQVLTLDAHTIAVLKAARYWVRASGGAFDPVRAATRLCGQAVRPGLRPPARPGASLDDVEMVSATQVRMHQAVCVDLGGIAKGHAVDQAIQVLAGRGMTSALVNAGGDMRAMGHRHFSVDIRHAGLHVRDRTLPGRFRLQDKAMATSVGSHPDTHFVHTTASRRPAWSSATVMAKDCLTADVLTKWALQSGLLCPQLKTEMRAHSARMWRSPCPV